MLFLILILLSGSFCSVSSSGVLPDKKPTGVVNFTTSTAKEGREMKRRTFLSKDAPTAHAFLEKDRTGALSPLKAMETLFAAAKKFGQTVSNARQHLICGAVARGVSVFIMYPLDTIKTRLQMQASQVAKLSAEATLMTKLLSLYKGCPESLFGQIPYGMLTFGSYEMYKELFAEKFPNIPKTIAFFLSACMGDITGSFWLVPSEVVKQRMQSGMDGGLESCLKSIWAKDGPGGFYRGYSGQLARDVPFRAIQMTTYETVKALYLRYRAMLRKKQGLDALSAAEAEKLSGGEGAFLGALAGSFAAGLTTPLDVIKTRMMTGAGKTTVAELSRQIFKSEGLPGFFRGLGPRVLYIGPAVAVFFMTYEVVKARLADTSTKVTKVATEINVEKKTKPLVNLENKRK